MIVQKALGQQNIDDLLKLSEEYKKSSPSHPSFPHTLTHQRPGELEIMAARSSAGDVFEERIVEERHTEYVNVAPPHDHVEYTQQHSSGALVVTANPPAAPPPPSVIMAAPQPTTQYVSQPAAAPQYVTTQPPAAVQYAPQPTAVQYAPEPTVKFARTAIVRDASPARSYTTTSYDSVSSYGTTTTGTSSTVTGPVIVDAYPPQHHHHQALVPVGGHEIVLPSRRRSRSRHHSRHGSRDVVRAERLSTGELVLYEEEVEHVEPTRNGVRLEKDKRGRMSISVPRNR